MSATSNLGLTKPAYSDFADVEEVNENMEIIDGMFEGFDPEKGIIETIYPVGSIYMSVNNANPGTLFPGTTWAQISDTFLMAAGSTYAAGSTGGAAQKSFTPSGTVGSHTLTTAEIPSHAHGLNNHVHSVGAHSHGLNSHVHSVGAHSHGLNNHTHSGPNHSHGVLNGANFGFATFDSNTDRPVGAPTGVGFISHQQGSSYYASYSTKTADAGTGSTGPASGTTANSSAFNTGGPSTGSTANSSAFNSGGPSTANTANAGSGGGHNHTFSGSAGNINVLPPYLAVYIWKRTA